MTELTEAFIDEQRPTVSEIRRWIGEARKAGAADERQRIAAALEAEDPKTAGLGGESGKAFARAVLKDFATRLRAGEIQ